MKNKINKVQILSAIKDRANKKKYTFTLSPAVKEQFAKWCKKNEVAESAVIEELIKDISSEVRAAKT